jgi:hypothetical protein
VCHALQELRLGDARVAQEADVHVAADAHPVAEAALRARHQHQEERLLDLHQAEDLGRNRIRQALVGGPLWLLFPLLLLPL